MQLPSLDHLAKRRLDVLPIYLVTLLWKPPVGDAVEGVGRVGATMQLCEYGIRHFILARIAAGMPSSHAMPPQPTTMRRNLHATHVR